MSKEFKEIVRLPILPIRDPNLVVFPKLFYEVDVARDFSIKATAEAEKAYGSRIIIGLQNDYTIDEPKTHNIIDVCAEAEIRSKVDLDNEKLRIIVVGTRLGVLRKVYEEEGSFWGDMAPVREIETVIDQEIRDKIEKIKEIVINKHLLSTEEHINPTNSDELIGYTYGIIGRLPITREMRILALSITDPKSRLNFIIDKLNEIPKDNTGIEVSEPDDFEDIVSDVPSGDSEIKRMKKKIKNAGMPPDVVKVAKNELIRLSMATPNHSEFHGIYNYLDHLTSLPWDKTTEDRIDIREAKGILDEDHYGLNKPKERILEFLAIRKLKPNHKGSILCFSGPPGTGKTSISESIAKSIGRKFTRMSLGGVNDDAEIRGHRRTYVGSIPGRVMENIKKIGSKNPVFVLDEVDKLCTNLRGDPSSALLEVLDPEQNHAFVDHYLGVPFDLSQVFFICTMNDPARVAPALRDRFEIIEFSGYSPSDKVMIAKNHLIPKHLDNNGLKSIDIEFPNSVIDEIIGEYTSEAGVRSLGRSCESIIRKMAVKYVSGEKVPNIIDSKTMRNCLGAPKVFTEKIIDEPEVGISTGLACNGYGGSILFIETLLISRGKGKVEKPTGNLGDVIKESIDIAYTWIRANSDKIGIEDIGKSNIHIHFPSGGIPKDGPSAGIAIVASMISALANKPVKNDIAATGEITLRGKILPVGGLKEKILAAHRAGVKQVIVPDKNAASLEDIPEDVMSEITIIGVSNLQEALELLLI